MATRKFKLNNTRVTKDNIKYKMKAPTEASVVSNTTNTRSFTSAVTYNAYKTIDDTSNKMRGKINSFLSDLLGTEIDEFCGFNDRNERYMRRLMLLNVSEHEITMDSLGRDAALLGDGSKITNMAQSPSYASDINYTDNFARKIDGEEKKKTNATRYAESEYSGNYVNHGQLYSKTTNLYYDDNNIGGFADKIYDKKLTGANQNSILYKTKVLFNQAKINTIISRFHTDGGCGSENGNENVGSIGDAKSIWGKSHGRNLLLKSVESGNGNGYQINGYNNPYCRVWTHHYQYDKLFKRIRPFYQLDKNGEFKSVQTLKGFHNWKTFGHDIPSNVTNSIDNEKKKWSWKSKDTERLWDRSVLQSNGFVNITPKYQGGGALNAHTKDCMFSIENLAWKGYDPYSFEQALSWEQRGPNGGRIMWFPPYGIEFNETTNVNWTEHQFIGRGENVYTYANTSRTGTLSFYLLVDHPSIIDYVQWHGGTKANGKTVKDSDLLRFFAGCDSGDSEDDNSLVSYVKPTPLTDEYVQNPIEETVIITPEPSEPSKTTVTETLALSFYVFYPNNYSGTYDHMKENVEAIAYLLAGDGAQKKNGDTKKETDDISLKMDDLEDEGNFKLGYESLKNSSGVTNDKDKATNYIYGTKPIWQNQKNRSTYIANNHKWYYRIDGEYKQPSNGDYYRNTYDQTLIKEGNYEDTTNFKLNSDANKVREEMKEPEDEEGKRMLFSLAEVAAALEKKANHSQTYVNIKNKCSLNDDRISELYKIFNGGTTEVSENISKTAYKIKSIGGIGYSNSHDANKTKSTSSSKTVSEERNELLAKQRCETVFDWLTNRYNVFSGVDTSSEIQDSVSGKKITTTDVSNIEAKKWRSAKITITLEREVTTTVCETETDGTTKYVGYTKKKDAEGNEYYEEDETGDKWTKTDDGIFTRTYVSGYSTKARSAYSTNDTWVETDKSTWSAYFTDSPQAVKIQTNNSGVAKYYINWSKTTNAMKNTNDSTDTSDVVSNNLRYDQEYHFFKKIQDTDPMVWDSLMKKIQYFDPAFHSSTPEGFNARLTFLQQCTRQGNTIGASDALGKSANNLAFGQAPYCVLRLGDFYNQMICIDNINIDYEGPQFDLNQEGIGVQPLLARVSLSFKFIGGGDLTGPVRRLQNAMTFNYYANTGLYDNRADRPEYKANEITGISTLDTDKSYAYTTQMAKTDNKK